MELPIGTFIFVLVVGFGWHYMAGRIADLKKQVSEQEKATMQRQQRPRLEKPSLYIVDGNRVKAYYKDGRAVM